MGAPDATQRGARLQKYRNRGFVRITDDPDILRFKADGSRRYNRDNKRRLNDRGLESIRWLWGGLQDDLPANLLRQMSAEKRSAILSHNSGQQRMNALLREVQGTIIPRSTVLTVAQQDDAMKRPRDARLPRHLGDEGFLVLGHQDADPHIARCLGLPVPMKGEFVSCRVVRDPAQSRRRAWLGDEWWRLADDGDPECAAPARSLYRKLGCRSIEFGPQAGVGPTPE